MKKLFIFALLVLPMTTFAASSVRVLGSGSNLPGSGTTKTTSSSAKVATTPKAALPKAAASAAKVGDGSSSRIGTVRVKPTAKTTTTTATGTTSNAAATAGSRFPVITPAHSYNTVVNPESGNGIKPGAQNVDLSNYYNKQEVDDKLDDPRFDMIRISNGNPRSKWIGNPLLNKRETEDGYVFMWIEE